MTDATQTLQDRLEISDLLVRYATSVDNREFDRLRSCFTGDAVASGFGTDMPTSNQDEILEFISTALKRFGTTQHLMGNQTIQSIEGDRALVTTDVQATHFLANDNSKVLTLWATYHDEMVRENGEWKIRNHRLQPRGTQTTG